MGEVTRKLTIFEGPDGSGKTTAAKAFAESTGAKYVHFPSLPRVGKDLGRMYVEAMLPALLGYQDVVFDRSWLSEMPYGIAFREGADRLTPASRRMLERLAMRCGAVVVSCQPRFDVVKGNFMSRRHVEMLDNEAQLKMVYDLYADQATDLPEVIYDYTASIGLPPIDLIEGARMRRHRLDLVTAGNWDAEAIIVGDSIHERKHCDPFYQWPFASFSDEGCSQWLAGEFDIIDVGEHNLLWVDVNQDLRFMYDLQATVVALGDQAYSKLYDMNITTKFCPNPQGWNHRNRNQRYPLADLI